MSGYQHDVYLSWRRAEPVLSWFNAYFFPEFSSRLASTLGHEPAIFLDQRDLEVGEDWKRRLGGALRASTVLVAIWEPQYFRSPWCRPS